MESFLYFQYKASPPPPFFFFFRLGRMLSLILDRSVGRIEKKKNLKKFTSSLGIGGLVTQHHCGGARKTTRREPKINMAEK